MEQSLYAQVIKFRRKDLKFDAADKNKNKSKFYKRKQTNENMETEMKETDDKLGKNDFLEDDNFDEAIPIQIRK